MSQARGVLNESGIRGLRNLDPSLPHRLTQESQRGSQRGSPSQGQWTCRPHSPLTAGTTPAHSASHPSLMPPSSLPPSLPVSSGGLCVLATGVELSVSHVVFGFRLGTHFGGVREILKGRRGHSRDWCVKGCRTETFSRQGWSCQIQGPLVCVSPWANLCHLCFFHVCLYRACVCVLCVHQHVCLLVDVRLSMSCCLVCGLSRDCRHICVC